MVWDRDRVIQNALALSRLVHPNGVWPEYAARVERAGGSLRIVPFQAGYRAYVTDPEARSWLTEVEMERLAGLISAHGVVREDPASGRVRGALWWGEYLAQTYFVEVRIAHAVTAFEALLNTDSRQATAQFVARLPILSEALDCPVSKSFVNQLYKDRSKTLHGSLTGLGQPSALTKRLVKTEDLLRVTLLRAIEDADFRATFATAKSINHHWGPGKD